MSLRDQIAPEMLAKIEPDRLSNIDIIEEEFVAAGLPIEFAAGAMANAWHESKFNNFSEGDWTSADRYTGADLEERCSYSNRPHPCPQSIGLFQLKSPTGAGGEMTVEERQDPRLNSRRMIEQINKKYGDQMRADYAAGERSVAHFAALFCRDIERPANKQGCWDKRAKTSLKFFPTDRVTGGGLSRIAKVGIGIGAGALIALFFGGLYWWYTEDD